MRERDQSTEGRFLSGPSVESRFRGCLLGGAIGDALGGTLEFLTARQIRERYELPITTFVGKTGRVIGAITDDTQMTLFTAEGILRAAVRADERGICHPPAVVHHAYVRWLWTQGERSRSQWPRLWENRENGGPDGWLAHLPALHARRAPGNTCLDALRGERMGTREEPLNDSKGCGGVMRIAPVGLLPRGDAFEVGCELAALTHGHPSGYLGAGVLALLIRRIMEGAELRASLEEALDVLERQPRHEETSRALHGAIAAAEARPATAGTVESLGAGWVAEEALAIGVYCALAAGDDFAEGVRLAVNHSGDSDSTGAITGNLLGARLGESAIPQPWLAELELRREIEAIADDLLLDYQGQPAWWERYPGW
jgi:ADP-ribosylglycohydrolase